MQYPEQGIRLRSSARTSTGQVRENNEDNIHLWTHDNFVLAIVADGMGGAAAGEEASRIAVEAIKAVFTVRDQRPDALASVEDAVVTERLRDAIQSANMSIVQKASLSPEMRGMGTTVTLAFVRGTYAIVAHVGDSRAYLVDGDDQSITQITSDHSFVEALLLAGHITPEQAEDHPMKNVLYRALGQAEDVDVDMYYKRLHIGDRLVLCSDGLTRHVKSNEIAKIALSDTNPDVVSQNLIDMANARGGEDNVSVIVVSVEGAMTTSPPDREAVIANPSDDDETLVLKDRIRMRTQPGGDESSPSSDEDEIFDTGHPPDNNPTMDFLRDNPKMTAERLNDDVGETTLLLGDEDITEDSRPLADEESFEASAHYLLGGDIEMSEQPPVEPQERHGEGRDTLIPDQ
jgi:PPM family protein phosphatase